MSDQELWDRFAHRAGYMRWQMAQARAVYTWILSEQKGRWAAYALAMSVALGDA